MREMNTHKKNVGNLSEREHVGNLDVNLMKVLKRIFKNKSLRMCIGLNYLRIGSTGGREVVVNTVTVFGAP
jgi:hypothetical protein